MNMDLWRKRSLGGKIESRGLKRTLKDSEDSFKLSPRVQEKRGTLSGMMVSEGSSFCMSMKRGGSGHMG